MTLTLAVSEFGHCHLTELVRQCLCLREAGYNALTDGGSCALLSHPPGNRQDNPHFSLDGGSVDGSLTQGGGPTTSIGQLMIHNDV